MAKKPVKLKVTKAVDAPDELPSGAVIRKMLDTDESALKYRKLEEISGLLWKGEGTTEEDVNTRLVRASDQFESLAPADGAEGMLALQMVGTHNAALECLRLAALPGQTFAGRDMALKHAHKLMSLYTQQLAALNKHRGKGQQKVTVEHVNVAAGGQAIVGNVETSGANRRRGSSAQAVTHTPEEPMADLTSAVPVGSKRKGAE
jgi:hypothetical protein